MIVTFHLDVSPNQLGFQHIDNILNSLFDGIASSECGLELPLRRCPSCLGAGAARIWTLVLFFSIPSTHQGQTWRQNYWMMAAIVPYRQTIESSWVPAWIIPPKKGTICSRNHLVARLIPSTLAVLPEGIQNVLSRIVGGWDSSYYISDRRVESIVKNRCQFRKPVSTVMNRNLPENQRSKWTSLQSLVLTPFWMVSRLETAIFWHEFSAKIAYHLFHRQENKNP